MAPRQPSEFRNENLSQASTGAAASWKPGERQRFSFASLESDTNMATGLQGLHSRLGACRV